MADAFSVVSFEARKTLLNGEMNILPGVNRQILYVVLMRSDFNFNPATHREYGDVTSFELPYGNGYRPGDTQLLNPVMNQNAVSGVVTVTFDPVQWTASGGDIGPTIGAVIYNFDSNNYPILGFINFGEPWTQIDGGTLVISGIRILIQ